MSNQLHHPMISQVGSHSVDESQMQCTRVGDYTQPLLFGNGSGPTAGDPELIEDVALDSCACNRGGLTALVC